MNANQLWNDTLAQLKLQLTKPTYNTWLTNTRGLALDDDHLTVAVPNQYVCDWLRFRLTRPINRALAQTAGRPITPIFTIHHNPSPSDPPLPANAADLQAQGASK